MTLNMAVVGSYYFVVKGRSIYSVFQSSGIDAANDVLHSHDNVSFSTLTFFACVNCVDLVCGVLFYRSQLTLMTSYLHHTIYVWLCYCALTGDGIFTTCRVFSVNMMFTLLEEIPTFLLALGSLFPTMRT